MNDQEIKETIERMARNHHKDYVKAVIRIEKGIEDEKFLDQLYGMYLQNDFIQLLHEDFDSMIEEIQKEPIKSKKLSSEKLSQKNIMDRRI